MNDKEYAPLSVSCYKALTDKMYERRKSAGFEIEKMIKEFVLLHNESKILQLIESFSTKFIGSSNPQVRCGGLMGLSSVALGLQKDCVLYIEQLIKPILICFSDPDARVRYYACEAFLNFAKVSRSSTLKYFNEIFWSLSKLTADQDQHVRSAVEVLDRLLKDIVTENTNIEIEMFIPVLRESSYTQNSFLRQFVVSWISLLDSIPEFNLLFFLPELIDGLFTILSDPSPEIKRPYVYFDYLKVRFTGYSCEILLGTFLQQINENPTGTDLSALVNILVIHSHSTDELLQITALTWLNDLLQLDGISMLPFTSGIIAAVLPHLAPNDSSEDTVEMAKAVNQILLDLVSNKEILLTNGNGSENNSSQIHMLDLPSLVNAIIHHLSHINMATRLASLRWIACLHNQAGAQLFNHIDVIFSSVMKILSDEHDEVVLLALEVLSKISSSSNENDHSTPLLLCLLSDLLEWFHHDNILLSNRDAQQVYQILAGALFDEKDIAFAQLMIQHLNMILLTSSELFQLRRKLNQLDCNENCQLFCCLYRSWSHHPVALLALCFLSQQYYHASQLILAFTNCEITLEFLSEVDKLIQLLESPIFAYLRIHLLDPSKSNSLIRSLYGLLMLLPQSSSFHLLRRRLKCLPCNQLPSRDTATNSFNIPFNELLETFLKIQEKHRILKNSMTYEKKSL